MRLLLKILMVIGLTIAILVPLLMIRGTIQDRQMYRREAVQTVARSSAGAQALSGPVLMVPYTELVEVEEKDNQGFTRKVRREESGIWMFFPETLEAKGTMKPIVRKIGLHQVRKYEFATKLHAEFQVTVPGDADALAPRKIGQPYLSYAIADVRGVVGLQTLTINGKDVELLQGPGSGDGGGLHARLPVTVAGGAIVLDSQLDFTLEGTESLAIAPLAKRNIITIDSPWPHPLFNGDFLPRKRTIDDKGFHAEWEISSLATNAQAQYLGGSRVPGMAPAGSVDAANNAETVSGLDAIGVSLVEPVNIYSQADRASKYGILFVLLTFVGFFMFELIKQLRIHPIQYGLVGLALAIFFLLLVALSEHMEFGKAYLVASGACIGLLGYYVSHVLRSWLRGFGFAAMLCTLYGALYGLLISEDNAMVLGAGLLFLILAAIMVVTRKIDWYSVGTTNPPPLPRG
ncbi:MAG: cell envelope integrity protein CreD [Xanthomonadales bacterium]|nr:cell envelope integrity protein CreD [Xanthomonadales bacterium]